MADDSPRSSKRVLEPYDRISEVLFGLIMVLTFTGSLSVASAPDDVRAMLIGALGCNVAWGIIDAVLYLMGSLAEKGRNLQTYRAVRAARDPREAHRLIADALPRVLVSILEPREFASIHERLGKLPTPPERVGLDRHDWLAALGVFLLVFASTFPVAIPFLFMQDAGLALRASNALAVSMMFILGWAFGRAAGHYPWLTGIAFVLLGGALVAMTIALGG